MEKKLRTIDYELEQTEKRLEDLLAGIQQLRKEVYKLIKTDSKIVYEQYITTSNNGYYNVKSRISEHTKIMYFHKKCP